MLGCAMDGDDGGGQRGWIDGWDSEDVNGAGALTADVAGDRDVMSLLGKSRLASGVLTGHSRR